MARKIITQKSGYAICVVNPDGRPGWLLDEQAEIKTYPSEEDAKKALAKLKRNSHYSWNIPVEVREFIGFANNK